jgi:maltose/moltooligosaccharide transporter
MGYCAVFTALEIPSERHIENPLTRPGSTMGSPASTAVRPKPRLSFWDIWNMSFGFLGIQFGFALQNANVSRIFETLGASVENIPILWIAAPVTGLIVQPIVGYFSDRTWNRLGRRRPYFLGGAVLASLALIAMPNSPALWVAAGMLWIMDASINISMEPFRAFVGDNLPSEQRTTGFAMQSFFIGTGAVVASMLPWLLTEQFGVSNQAPEGMIPDSVRLSFYLGAAVFFAAVLWTVIRSKEYSPEEMASFKENQEREGVVRERRTADEYARNGVRQLRLGSILFVIGALLSVWLVSAELYQVMILSAGMGVVGLLLIASGLLQRGGRYDNGFVTILNDFQDMPHTMRQLAWVQFFSWFALFAMWIYTTAAVTSHIYGTSDTTSALFNEGANWVGVAFAVYNGVAAVVAFGIPVLAKRTSRKIAHAICLVCGALGLLSIFVISEPRMLLGSMVGVGIAWASILSMPYAILTGSLPPSKLGYYMGVFNFFIVIPQIVAAAILGFFVGRFFGGEAIYALLIGGISLVLAAALTLRVEDRDDVAAAVST